MDEDQRAGSLSEEVAAERRPGAVREQPCDPRGAGAAESMTGGGHGRCKGQGAWVR